jgi:PAS domain-containing protein
MGVILQINLMFTFGGTVMTELYKYIIENGEKVSIGAIAVMLVFVLILLLDTRRKENKQDTDVEKKQIAERQGLVDVIQQTVTGFQQVSEGMTGVLELLGKISLVVERVYTATETHASSSADLIDEIPAKTAELVASKLTTSREEGHRIAVGVFIVDSKGIVRAVNEYALSFLGATSEGLLHKSINDTPIKFLKGMAPEFLEPDEHPYIVALKTKERVSSELIGVYHKDPKRWRWFMFNANPIKNQNGAVEGVIVTMFDVGSVTLSGTVESIQLPVVPPPPGTVVAPAQPEPKPKPAPTTEKPK